MWPIHGREIVSSEGRLQAVFVHFVVVPDVVHIAQMHRVVRFGVEHVFRDGFRFFRARSPIARNTHLDFAGIIGRLRCRVLGHQENAGLSLRVVVVLKFPAKAEDCLGKFQKSRHKFDA